MGHSQKSKAESRTRILDAAAREIRRSGFDGASLAALMAAAGLTHGGFYKHFGSRQDLLAAALAHALDTSAGRQLLSGAAADAPAFLRSYLSRTHRDDVAAGCPLAALGADAARSDSPELRAEFAAGVERFIGGLAAALGDEQDERAMVVASLMIGALVLARATSGSTEDADRSDQLLRTARAHAERLLEGSGSAVRG